MKKYRLKKQEKENYCVASCLQAILRKYSYKFSQDEIAENLTPLNKGFNTSDKKITNFLEKQALDYSYYEYNKVPFNEPYFLLNENKKKAEILIGNNSHCYLFLDFKDPIVYLQNPDNSKKEQHNLSDILKNMNEKKSGFFGLIKKLTT